MINQKIFRAYDIRGTYPDQLNEKVAYKIACAYVNKLKPKTVVVGRDIREASKKMFPKIINALIDNGVNVKDAGQMTNPMIGFAIFNYGFDGGLILSGSHNPIGYGGIKMFAKNAVTIPGEDKEIKKGTLEGCPVYSGPAGKLEKIDIVKDYIKFVRSMIDVKKLKRKKILLDPMYGSVGLILNNLLENLPVDRIDFQTKPDQKFGGLPEPNPLNPKIRKKTIELAKKKKPDFGVMWDGDGDRIFFIDEKGNFIDAPYIGALLMEVVAKKHPKANFIVDFRIIWPAQKAAKKIGIKLYTAKAGYRFLKEAMKKYNSTFASEMTAHYFFKETKYMDSGVIPFLMIWELISTTDKKLSELVAPYKKGHYMIKQRKYMIEDPSEIIAKLKKKYSEGQQDEKDGLTVGYKDWRFNFRPSHTEPAAKLNLEAKDKDLMTKKTKELNKLIIKK